MGEEKTFFNTFTLAVLIIILAVLVYILLTPAPKTATVHFLDVGQGDAELVVTPFNQRILIDGGPSASVVAKLDRIIPFYQKRLDAVILTHPHADHLDGLLEVLKTYEVKKVYITGVLYSTPEYLEFLNELKAKKIATYNVAFDKQLSLDGGIKVNFLYPLKNLAGTQMDNVNNSSIVTKIIWDKESFLFMGDLEAVGQDELMASGQELKANVLKVAHHGSKDGANEKFDQLVSSQVAVIEVGKDNQFGHPNQIALNFLKFAQIFRTDQDGDVNCDFNQTAFACHRANY